MRLREVVDADLDVFFAHQADPEAHELAGLSPRDRQAFDAHWARIRSDPSVTLRTIEIDGEVAGNVVSFEQEGIRLVGYWLGREFWGRGLASRALTEFLVLETHRPLVAEVSAHNARSVRVLEKNGFRRVRELPDGYAYALG